MTRVVNLHRKEPYDVYVGRPGRAEPKAIFGNPIQTGSRCPICDVVHREPKETIPCFAKLFLKQIDVEPSFRAQVLTLKDKRLGCFCSPALPRRRDRRLARRPDVVTASAVSPNLPVLRSAMPPRLYVGTLNGGSFLLTCPPKSVPPGVAGWCNHEVLLGLGNNSEELALRLASAWNAIIDGQFVRPSFVSHYNDDLASDVYGIHVIVASGDWTHEAAEGVVRKDLQDFIRITRDEEYAQRARRRAELGLEAARKLLLLDLAAIHRVSSWGEGALHSFIHESVDQGYRVAILPSTKNLAQLTGLKILLKPLSRSQVAFIEGSSRRAALWLYCRPEWENTP